MSVMWDIEISACWSISCKMNISLAPTDFRVVFDKYLKMTLFIVAR